MYLDIVGLYKEREKHSFFVDFVAGESKGKQEAQTLKEDLIEYGVLMVRLPQYCVLHSILQEKKKSKEEIEKMVEKICCKMIQFYLSPLCETVVDNKALENVFFNHQENMDQTKEAVGVCVSSQEYEEIERNVSEFLKEKKQVFERRHERGFTKNCHGDFHSCNIFFLDDNCKRRLYGEKMEGEEVLIFDCIEFNERIRQADVACDLAFFSMDLFFHLGEQMSKKVAEIYVRETGDKDALNVFGFYVFYRAMVRAKVNFFTLQDQQIEKEEREKAKEASRKYFQIAVYFSRKLVSSIEESI